MIGYAAGQRRAAEWRAPTYYNGRLVAVNSPSSPMRLRQNRSLVTILNANGREKP